MKGQLLLILSSVLIMLASCTKDHKVAGTTGIQGTYKLKYITLNNTGTQTVLNRKTVNASIDTTINNTGMLVIDASTLTANGFTYELNSTSTTYLYTDNVLVDSSMKTSFSLKYPVINSSSSYKLIGTDSIYFAQGTPASAIFSTSSMPGASYCGKYTLSGNVLTIIQSGIKDTSFHNSGLTYYIKGKGVATMVLEKQ